MKKQVRMQLSNNLHTPSSDILSVATPIGMCIVDSCSDVTLARRDVLSRLHVADVLVVIIHLGGETILREARSLALGVPGVDKSPLTLHDVLAVDVQDLPAGVVALIGLADVRLLGLSLDAILACPGRDLSEVISVGRWGDEPVGAPAVQERQVLQETANRNWDNPRRAERPLGGMATMLTIGSATLTTWNSSSTTSPCSCEFVPSIRSRLAHPKHVSVTLRVNSLGSVSMRWDRIFRLNIWTPFATWYRPSTCTSYDESLAYL